MRLRVEQPTEATGGMGNAFCHPNAGTHHVYTSHIMGATRSRRLGGWGFEGEAYPPSPQLPQWHAPWYEQEVTLHGRRMVEAAVRHMNPEDILNPHVLLDPDDRLEV